MGEGYQAYGSRPGGFSYKAKILEALSHTKAANDYGLENFGVSLAVARRLLRVTALQEMIAGDCLNSVASALTTQRKPSIFVPIFCGILSTETREPESDGVRRNPYHLFTDPDATGPSKNTTVQQRVFSFEGGHGD
jgi:hypothetical protein